VKYVLRDAILLAGLAVVWAATPAYSADASNICAHASLSNPDEGSGGMGGTGVMASTTLLAPGSGGMGGTGIVGIVTGFASICVNDVEVHYDARTPVSVNGRAAAARDLAVGQLVVVHASTAGGQFRANGIGAIDAVNGPVTRVDPAAHEIQVMGQTVRVGNAISPDLATIKPGTSVRVSGLRTENGIIVASRLDAVPAVSGASLLGIVSRAEGNTAVVNGTRIDLPLPALAQPLPIGSEVFVAGEWNGSALQARRVEAQPVHNAIARTERAIVEGFVTSHRGNQLNIGSVTVQLSDRVRYTGGNDRDAEVGRKVQVEIRRAGDTWFADRVILQRSDNARGEGRKIPSATTSDSRGDQESRSGLDGGTSSQDSGGRGHPGSSGSSGSSGSGNSGSSDSGGPGSSNSGSTSSGPRSSSTGSSGSGSSNSGSGNSAASGSGSNSSGSGSSGLGSGRSGSSSAERSSGSGSSAGSGSRGSGSRGGRNR
jgi:uncharacterized protein DUF5666